MVSGIAGSVRGVVWEGPLCSIYKRTRYLVVGGLKLIPFRGEVLDSCCCGAVGERVQRRQHIRDCDNGRVDRDTHCDHVDRGQSHAGFRVRYWAGSVRAQCGWDDPVDLA